MLKQRDPQVERFRTGILVRFEEMSGRWVFVSLLFVVSSIDHAAIGLASSLIHQRQSEKKGRKNFCKERKTFFYGIPFFSAYHRCKFKARQTAISYARMSEINNEERRSKNKCPMTFLKIKAFSPPTNRLTQMDL
ncbi:hypothetical protein [Enterococcus mundtii]|uniref:hypothetical protein n=1 Tax=Enterococcus mundtii TaxID=53346 RepID=UPI00403C67AF